MQVLAAMSGGVDSSVAAALLAAEGHEVVGVTMKLWGGPSDTGCCSVADVIDARRVADALGLDHHVFNFGEDFSARVVEPYVADHAAGRTPNPCVECNRHIKFERLLRRAEALGFDAVATGHHARVVLRPDGTRRLARGADAAKDQSYVLYMLGQEALAKVLLPVGHMTKDRVRALAAELGLRTAAKPDSTDVCFIQRGERGSFLAERIVPTPARVLDTSGRRLGEVPSVQIVTLGQRKGLGVGGQQRPMYAVDVDVAAGVVTVGDRADLLSDHQDVREVTWAAEPPQGPVLVQASAHGAPRPATLDGARVCWQAPQQRVAPGQSVVFYDGDEVLGGGIAA
ncbi:MAG: tRNA 2-thiouridine(34) synthase MnmA [bacterium]|nr:tRNA 2-thiouridine(34) synthase MnmA [bacterium]MXZ29698.1 tRNA 2-thiouridine(34) synthase MnmA [Acidimicrobiia bacterium]